MTIAKTVSGEGIQKRRVFTIEAETTHRRCDGHEVDAGAANDTAITVSGNG
ncbi:MAG: hypothetical protein ACLVJ6_11015 [Merdibacter sp.]